MRISDWSSDVCSSDLRSERRLGELAGSLHEVLDLDERFLRVDDSEIDHRVDPHRYIIMRDHVLRGHIVDDRAQIGAHHLLDDRDQDAKPRPLHAGKTTKREYHGAFIFAKYLGSR